MNTILRNATIVDPGGPFHLQKADLLIVNGEIIAIGNHLEHPEAEVRDADNMHVSPGFVDIGAHTMDPGFEHREDLQSFCHAAARGGYTRVAPFPNTHPYADNKSEIKYLQSLNGSQAVHIHPIGGLSQNGNGEDIAELYDMREAGAIAFSDGSTSVEKSGLLLRAMQYVKPFEGLIIDRPVDASLTSGGQIHEGAVSVALGLRGIPSLAETTRVYRNIQLLEYADSKLHFQGISSAESLSILRKAKAEGHDVFASVPVWNLVFTDDNLRGYDTHFKLLTPLRNQSDKEGLRAALKEGLLSAITSDHTPLESDRKDLEFPYADFGATSLETTFALANTHLVPDILSLADLVERISNGPRKILGLEPVHIRPNAIAEMTIYDPAYTWTPDPKNQASKSYNSPLYSHVLHGKILGVIHGEQQSFN